jgi:flagellin-specific chaperone FliS
VRANTVAKAYASVDISSKTLNRSPEELIALLLDKACECLKRASMLPIDSLEAEGLENRLGIIEEFHKSTSKALQIVVALNEMLDMETGGELSQQLSETYTIIARNIWEATRNKNRADLAKLYAALAELRVGWENVVHA